MKIIIYVMTLVLVLSLGCTERSNPSDPNTKVDLADMYKGILTFTKRYSVYDYRQTYYDTVTLSIVSNSYNLTINDNPASDLCNSSGTIEANSLTGFVTLSLMGSSGTNCDNKRLPDGLFEAEITDSSLEMENSRIFIWVANNKEYVDTLEFKFDLKVIK